MLRNALLAVLTLTTALLAYDRLSTTPTDASVRQQTRTEVRSQVCYALGQAVDSLYLQPPLAVWSDSDKQIAALIGQTTIGRTEYGTPGGCRELWRNAP